MIFDQFDMIRIINLRERRDRRRQMLKELARVGLKDDPRVAFFDAIRPCERGRFYSVGAHGVFLSHCAILSDAANRDASVLILEDDCYFDQSIAHYRCTDRGDIFYGGHNAAEPQRLHESDVAGAHMMGFSAEAARQILAYFSSLDCAGQHPPIDGAYVWFRRAHPDVTTTFAVPPIGHQRSSRSDIAQLRVFDRLPIVRECVEMARGVRNVVWRPT